MKPSSKAILLSGLYFSQGLPYGFFTQAVPVFLRKENLSLTLVGASYLLALPWALKFLWAPLADLTFETRYGRRKSWILSIQILSMALLIALSFMPIQSSEMSLLVVAVFFVNFLAASQDVGTDGLAVDLLDKGERGWANGIQVAGYRLGMITGGGAILVAYNFLQWRLTFLLMAALSAISTLPLLFFSEPKALKTAQGFKPLAFLTSQGASLWIMVVFFYKLGDEMARGMLRPFLVDQGLSIEQIGSLLGASSFGAGLVGALVGGYLAGRSRTLARGLVIFSAIQSLGAFSYLLLTHFPFTLLNAYLVCTFDHFVGGMATACLFTLMMDASNKIRSASDYTFQACVVVVATTSGSAASGLLAESFGYQGHFLFSALVCVATTALSYWLLRDPKVRSLLSSQN